MSLNCKKVAFAISCLVFFIIIFAMVIFITTYSVLNNIKQVRTEVKAHKNISNTSRLARQAVSTSSVETSGLITLLQKLLSILNMNNQISSTRNPSLVTEWQRPVVTPLPPSRPMIQNWFRTTTNRPLPFNTITRCGMANHVLNSPIQQGMEQNSNLEWMVSIQSGCNADQRHVCGGVLVTDQHVVTTATCLQSLRCARVVIGASDLSQVRPDYIYAINRILVHPLKSVHVFSFQNLIYQSHLPDLAIVRLDRRTNLMPICLPDEQHAKYIFHYFNFAGWGQNNFRRKSRYNHQLINVRLDNLDCKNANKALNVNSNEFLCIRHTLKGGRVCSNDEGGPLMYKVNGIWYAYGILFKRLIERRVDWINPKCEHNNIGFSVYTKFLDNLYWIRNNLN